MGAGGGDAGGGDAYRAPLLARLLHALPHLNITLQTVNDTFAPHSDIYIESLGILGSIPAAWLILTLLVLLIYLLTRCCDRKPRPPKSIKALKITLIILSVLCCGAIGLGFYANDDLHNSSLQTLQAGKQLAAMISTARNQSEALQSAMGVRALGPLTRLTDTLDAPTANQTALGLLLRALDALRNNASAAANAARDLHAPLMRINVHSVVDRLWYWEVLWWIGWMCGWSVLGVVCVALLCAAVRCSRRALLALSVCSLAALVLCWLAAAVCLVLSVALADACQAPADAIVAMYRPYPYLSADVVQYYLTCAVPRENVLTGRLREAQRAVLAVRQALATLSRGAPQLFNDPGLQPALGALSASTGEAERVLGGLGGVLECAGSRAAFAGGARAACGGGLQGLALLLLATALAGLLLTAVVWVDSHVWIYIGKKRESMGADENAPFLPGGVGGASSAGGSASSRHLGTDGTASTAANSTLSSAPRTLPRANNQGSYYNNNKTNGIYGTSKKEGIYGTSKKEGIYGNSKKEGIYGNSKKEGIYGTSKKEGIYGTSKNGHGAPKYGINGNASGRNGQANGMQMSHYPPPPTYSAAVALAAMEIDEGPTTDITLYTQNIRGEVGIVSGGGGVAGGRGGSGGGGNCHTLGRLPSHQHATPGPNNGKYATLSKQCKTLESSDFY